MNADTAVGKHYNQTWEAVDYGMRRRWANEIRRSGLTLKAKTVAAELAEVSMSGEYWIGVDGLADVLQLSRSSVVRALAELDSAGLIDRRSRKREDGRNGRGVIALVLDAHPTLPTEAQPDPWSHTSGLTLTQTEAQPDHDLGSARACLKVRTEERRKKDAGRAPEPTSAPDSAPVSSSDSKESRVKEWSVRVAEQLHEYAPGSPSPRSTDAKALVGVLAAEVSEVTKQESLDEMDALSRATRTISYVFQWSTKQSYWTTKRTTGRKFAHNYAELRAAYFAGLAKLEADEDQQNDSWMDDVVTED